MIDVLEIRDQRLSTILADFLICQACRIVNEIGIVVKWVTSAQTAKPQAKAGSVISLFSIMSLIDLMQEFYHLNKSDTSMPANPERVAKNHHLAVVIFFCTLGEVLLQDFLQECMTKQGLSRQIQSRLLDDHLFVKQRVDKLFPLLTGVSWNQAIRTLSNHGKIDFTKTVKLYQFVSNKRNMLLHRGNKWVIPSEMPEQCVREICPLISLFVALHNKYFKDMSEKRVNGRGDR